MSRPLILPYVGLMVHYKLNQSDAGAINRRRTDACASGISSEHSGAIIHVGNTVLAGDVYPMVITRIWGSDHRSAVQGQVFLDGNDVYWATSRTQGNDEGQWHSLTSVPGGVE